MKRIVPRVSLPIRRFLWALLILPLGLIILSQYIHIFLSARAKAREMTCQSNMKQLGVALSLYRADWDETLPMAERWDQAAAHHIEPSKQAAVFHCPEARSPFSYAFNVELSTRRIETVEDPAHIVMFFESDANRRNAIGGKEALPHQERHAGRDGFMFVDGHIRYAGPYSIQELRWNP